MSEYGDRVQAKCDAFADRIVKLNDYLLEQAANRKADVSSRAEGQSMRAERQTSSRVPVFLQSVATISNQLLRAGTSVGANFGD